MSNQIVITSGAKLRDLDDVIIGTDGILSSVAFNVANGVPRLDENGKILVTQLPNSVMEFKGVWNAATNSPFLENGVGNAGDVWLCNEAGTVDFGDGPIYFAVGDYAVYTGEFWARSSGATGTVTSVGVSRDGNALAITGSPVTSSGTINLGFSGDNTQYINGAGNLTTFPTVINSIGLTMPAAFGVSNSPLVANGTIGVTALGFPSQYIRGDGTLADFPTSGGGGSSVSYYLNGGTSQGTIGGTTYYEMSKTADTGTMADFSKTGDGLITAFLTDAGDPSLLQIPAGNWNYEIYASMSSNGGTPEMYAELYVYNGTTFTLISTSSNEILYDGTNLNLYSFAMTVPETVLTVTDRLAIKLYATNSGGKTTTVHTQDSHLCQVITTFTTGLTALNGLTSQVQYFATGTSGSDFNIVSSVSTHTFNIPSASATARGLITTGTQTIAGSKTITGTTTFTGGPILSDTNLTYANSGYTLVLQSPTLSVNRTVTLPNGTGTLALTSDLSGYVDLTTDQTIGGTKTFSNATKNNGGILLQNGSSYSLSGYMNLGGMTNGLRFTSGLGISNYFALPSATGYTYTFDTITGTIAMLEGTQTFSGSKTFTNVIKSDSGVLIKNGVSPTTSGYIGIGAGTSGINVSLGAGGGGSLIFQSTSYNYTFPSANGTVALTSDISYPVTSVFGRTGAVVATSGDYTTDQVTEGLTNLYFTTARARASISVVLPLLYNSSTGELNINMASTTVSGWLSYTDFTTFNNKQATITLTTTGTSGAATFVSNTLNIPQYQAVLTNPITGTGTSGQIGYFNGTSTLTSSATLTYTPTTALLINNSITASGAVARGINLTSTLTAAANSDILVALDINPTYTNGSFTSVSNYALRVKGIITASASSTNLTLQQTGDTYGTTQLILLNRDGSNGAIFKNLGLDLVDFGFVTSTAAQGNIRFEKRSGNRLTDNTTGEFQFVIPSSSGFAYFQSGFYATSISQGNLLVGTTTNSTYKLDVVGTARISGATLFSSSVTANNSFTNQIGLVINGSTTGGIRQNFIAQGSSGTYNFQIGTTITTNNAFEIIPSTAIDGTTFSTAVFKILNTGAATFSSSVTATSFNLGNGQYLRLTRNSGALQYDAFGIVAGTDNTRIVITNDFDIVNGSLVSQFKIAGSGAATFSKPLSVIGVSSVGQIFIDGDQVSHRKYSFTNAIVGVDNAGFTLRDETSSTNLLNFTSGGAAGMGDNGNASFKLSVTGAGGGVIANCSGAGDANFLSNSSAIGKHFLALSGASTVFYVASSGQIYSTSTSIISISDIAYKENVKSLETGLKEIMALKPSRFDWKEGRGNGKKNVAGFIAQDLELVLPDLIDEYEKEIGSNEYLKGIRMTDLIPTMVKSIQELKQEIETLKNK